MPRPTDAQRRANPQEEKIQGKYRVCGKEYDIEITAKTKPNAAGGWDTEMHVPVGRIGIRPNKPGG